MKNERLLSDEVKQKVFQLMRSASKAHGAMKAADKRTSLTDELAKLRGEWSTFADQLQDAVINWTLEQVKEMGAQAQYEITRQPLMAIGSGKYSWDTRLASTLVKSLRSLKTALVLKNEEESRNDVRVQEVGKRIWSTEAFIDLFEALDVPPVVVKNNGNLVLRGMNYEVKEFGLRKLNEKIAELNAEIQKLADTDDNKKAQLNRQAGELNDLYLRIKNALGWLKPFVHRPYTPKTGMALGETLSEEGVKALKERVTSAASDVPPAPPAGKREGGRKRR